MMAIFVTVQDVEKNCEIIINLDTVMEIAPKMRLENGRAVDDGCELAFPDAAAVGGRRTQKVKDSYSMFKQFAMQTVSAEDIAKVNGRISKDIKKEKPPVSDIMLDIPKL